MNSARLRSGNGPEGRYSFACMNDWPVSVFFQKVNEKRVMRPRNK
jgi:hypothetical protein